MRRLLLAEAWNQLANVGEGAMPESISQSERRNLRSAFYLGAQTLLLIMAAESEDGRPVQEIILDFQEELYDFKQAVEEGRA